MSSWCLSIRSHFPSVVVCECAFPLGFIVSHTLQNQNSKAPWRTMKYILLRDQNRSTVELTKLRLGILNNKDMLCVDLVPRDGKLELL